MDTFICAKVKTIEFSTVTRPREITRLVGILLPRVPCTIHIEAGIDCIPGERFAKQEIYLK